MPTPASSEYTFPSTPQAPSLPQQLVAFSVVNVSALSVSTTVTGLNTLMASLAGQQAVCITNTSANILYVGYLSTLSASAGWSFRLYQGDSVTIPTNSSPNAMLYVIGSAASTTFTAARCA